MGRALIVDGALPGDLACGARNSLRAVITADDSSVAFVSDATNLAPWDTNNTQDGFIRTHSLNTGQPLTICRAVIGTVS